jgi:hypothetical protein
MMSIAKSRPAALTSHLQGSWTQRKLYRDPGEAARGDAELTKRSSGLLLVSSAGRHLPPRPRPPSSRLPRLDPPLLGVVTYDLSI